MPLVRSRSLPGVGVAQCGDEDSCNPPCQGRDSGVLMGSDPPSYISDHRSSLLGEMASGADGSDPPRSGIEESPKGCHPREQGAPEDEAKRVTIGRHYYPEGGWGWVVLSVCLLTNILVHGFHQALGVILIRVRMEFPKASLVSRSWLGGMTTSIALFLSPLTIAVCRRKSTRLTAVLGGLVTALGCLFTSFASRYHQLFFSYGTVIG